MKTYLLMMIIVLLLAGSVVAQDATSEPDSSDVPTVTLPANETLPSADPAITLKWWQVLAGLFAAVGVGGVGGVAGAGVIARRMRDNPATLAAIEGLANSVPADVAKLMLGVARSGKEVALLAEEAFDGVPAAAKPGPAAGIPAAG